VGSFERREMRMLKQDTSGSVEPSSEAVE